MSGVKLIVIQRTPLFGVRRTNDTVTDTNAEVVVRKITYLNPPKFVEFDFKLQRRFAANYLFR